MTIFLAISGTLTGTNLSTFLHGTGDVKNPGIAAAVFGAITLLFAWATYQSLRSQLHVRLVPYFEQRLDTSNAWLSGENLLLHSRQLDEIAVRHGVQPLSEFASGDDMIRGEVLCWFSSADALRTLDRLLQPDVTTTLPSAVVTDMTHVRDSLRLACSKASKFCFIIREGTSASDLEMKRRKGSFF